MTGQSNPARVTIAADSDEFVLAIPGVSGSLVRTGRGTADSTVAARAVGTGHVALLDLQYPMVGDAHSGLGRSAQGLSVLVLAMSEWIADSR